MIKNSKRKYSWPHTTYANQFSSILKNIEKAQVKFHVLERIKFWSEISILQLYLQDNLETH